jgi:hypothetical protein
MIGTGHLPDYQAGRELIRNSFDFRTYTPNNIRAWEAAYARFKGVLGLSE